MKDFLGWLDPHRQGPWYFKWGFWSVLLCAGAFCWLCVHWDGAFVNGALRNIFVFFPNYLVHEMLGHNCIGLLGWKILHPFWPEGARFWHVICGSGVEVMLPFTLLLVALRLQGGRWLLGPLWYWLASSLYSAGIYASDARAMKLPLTSSDMMTNYAPGQVKGDWYNILEPLGLLNYDVIIGRTLIFLSFLCFIFAVYSLYYYWTHTDQYLYNNNRTEY